MKRYKIRKEILQFQPYIAGKPIDEVKRKFGLKKVYKLASNENAWGTSNEVITEIKKKLNLIYLYPDSSSYYLKQALSKHYNIPSNKIIIGNGSDEIIEIIGKTLLSDKDEVIVSEHAFIRFKMAADLMGASTKIIPMKNFKHDIETMAKSVSNKTKIIFIANPNNPTGTYNTKEEFDRYFKLLSKVRNKVLTVIDEAYYEYAKINPDYPDGLDYLKRGKNVIVMRTFSKAYGLAGLRVGYAFASSELIKYMDRIRPPFNVNILAQIAAENALKDEKHIEKTIRMTELGKEYLYKELEKLKLRFIPSATNFILVDVSPHTGKKIFKKLLRTGVIVRSMEEYGLPQYIRVTIGKSNENKIFIEKIKYVLHS